MFYNNGYNQDWSTLKKLVWLRGNPATGQIGTDLTVSGTPPLSLPNSLGKPLKAWEVDVLPKQELHGYDNPWPAGGGVNKADLTGATAYSETGTYGLITSISGDTITISGTYTPSSAVASFRSFVAPNVPTNLSIKTFELTDGNHIERVYFSENINFAIQLKNMVTNTDYTIKFKIVAYEGSTAPTAWSPYANICPIYGTDKVTITTAGKNLLPLNISIVKPLNTLGSWDGNVYEYLGIYYAFEVDANGNVLSIYITGQKTGGSYVDLARIKSIPYGEYILNGGASSIQVRAYHYNGTNSAVSYGSDVTFISTAGAGNNTFDIAVNTADPVDAYVYPMVRIPTISDTAFVHYIAPSQTVIDVPPLSANKWDEETESGYISSSTGQPVPDSSKIRMKNYVPVLPETTYYKVTPVAFYNCYYDKDKNFLGYGNASQGTFTTPANCYYLRAGFESAYGTTYNHDIAINYPSTVTTYNPYNTTVYTGTIGSDGGESGGILETFNQIASGGGIASQLNYLNTTSVSTVGAFTRISFGIRSEVDQSPYNRISSSYDVKMCNMAKHYFSYADESTHWYRNTGLYVYLPTSLVGDTYESVNNYLISIKETTPLTLFVPYNTDVQFPLTAPTIPTPTGTATTWATAEDGTVDSMEVTYVGKA